MCPVDFSERRRGLQSFDRIIPVFLRDHQAAVCQLRVGVLQYARCQSFHSADAEVPFGIVDCLAKAIVCGAHDPISPVTNQLPGAAISSPKSRFKHPIQSPASFLQQPIGESRICALPLQGIRKRQQGINHSGRVAGRRKVPGIVISAVHDNALVIMNRIDILMTTAVNARDICSAPLAVHKINRFPDAVEPCVIADAKRASQGISRFDHVGAWPVDFRKIQHLILAQPSAGLLDRFRQNDLAGLCVHHGELSRRQITGNCGLRGTGCVSAVAECNFPRGNIPSLHVIGHDALQFQLINV